MNRILKRKTGVRHLAVVVSSTSFEMPQHISIRQDIYKVKVRELTFYRDKISFSEKEEERKGNPNLPIKSK